MPGKKKKNTTLALSAADQAYDYTTQVNGANRDQTAKSAELALSAAQTSQAGSCSRPVAGAN